MENARSDVAMLRPILEDKPTIRRLDNGLEVLHLEDHSSALASVQIWVKTGSIHEGQLLGSGVSHFVEHMLFKGTKRRSAHEISLRTQLLGGGINAYTSFNRTVYHIDLPSEHFREALDLLADMVFDSRMDAEDIEAERNVILREIDMGLDDPDRRVSRLLFRTAFREHPYRFPVIGERPLFVGLRDADLTGYYRARYRPGNMVLVVVGAVTEDDVVEAAEALLGPREATPIDPVFIPSEPGQLGPREARERVEMKVCRGGLAFRIPSLRDPASPALDVWASILGQGRSSLLWRRLRNERRLVHHIDASCWNPGTSGLFLVSYLCDPARREEVEAAIREELESAVEGEIDRESIEKARRSAIVAEVNSRKTMAGLAARLGYANVVVGDMDYAARYFEQLEQVDAQAMASVAGEYLVESGCTSISFGDPVRSEKRSRRASAATEIEQHELPNGARLVLQCDARLPKVHLRVGASGGALYESPERRGLTTLMATLLTRDTAHRSAEEVATLVETAGGRFAEFSGNNSFGLSAEMLRGDLDLAFKVLGEALFAPRFQQENLDIERDAQIAQIREDLDDVVEFGRRQVRACFFGEHPFAVDSLGRIEDLERMEVADLVAQYQRLVVGSNLVFCLMGDVDRDEAFERLTQLAGQAPMGILEPVGNNGLVGVGGQQVFHQDRAQAVVFDAFPDCGVTRPDNDVGDVLDTILSDMSGELFQRVRETQSLAYFVGTSRLLGREFGMFSYLAGTAPGTADTVFDEFNRSQERVRRGDFTAEELEGAVNRLRTQRRSAYQNLSSRAAHSSLNVLFGMPADDWRSYDERIAKVDRDALRDFAVKYLDPDRRMRVAILPKR